MRVTVALLKRRGACRGQIERFKEHFPDGVDVTEAACVAVANEFDWTWVAWNLLPAPLDADYEAKRAALFGRLAETI